MHLDLYWQGFDHTGVRRELARQVVQAASRVAPDAGEVHLMRAAYAYQGFRDYDRARAELDLARRTLPNDPQIYVFTGSIDRRQGRWTEAIRNFERSIDLGEEGRFLVAIAGDADPAAAGPEFFTQLWNLSDHFLQPIFVSDHSAFVPKERAELAVNRIERNFAVYF